MIINKKLNHGLKRSVKVAVLLVLLLLAGIGSLKVTVRDSEAEEHAGTTKVPSDLLESQVLVPAKSQRIQEQTDSLKILVNCPVLATNTENIVITIGNMGTKNVSYRTNFELQVYRDGIWYVLESELGKKLESSPAVEPYSIIVLTPGMAMDENVYLSDYLLDYSAEKYRIVAKVGEDSIAAEFYFEDDGQMLAENLPEEIQRKLEEEK